MPTKIILAGEGGQGVQTIAKIIAKAAQQSGKKVAYIPSFGVEQRGGVSLSFVQISSKNVPYPRFSKANIAVVFCNRAIEPIKRYLAEDTLFIYDSSAISGKQLEKVKKDIRNYLALPALKTAKEKFTPKTLNMIFLGAISTHLKEIHFSEIENKILKEFEEKIKKDPQIKEINLGALNEGVHLAESFDMRQRPLTGAPEQEIIREVKDDQKTWTRFPEYCKGCGLCIVTCPDP